MSYVCLTASDVFANAKVMFAFGKLYFCFAKVVETFFVKSDSKSRFNKMGVGVLKLKLHEKQDGDS